MKRSRCPKCGYPLGKQPIPAAPKEQKAAAPMPVKVYALERKFAVRRVNGGFV